MDFSIPNIFVLASANTFPTAGTTTDALTGSQFGIYNQNNVAINAGNAAAQLSIKLVQNRLENIPGIGTKKSDLIVKGKTIREYKKFTPVTSTVPQISFIGNTGAALDLNTMTIRCDETYSVTLRLFSEYIDVGFYNGLTQSVTVKAPCCDACGDNCDVIDPVSTLQQLVDKINAHEKLSLYVTAALITNVTDADNPLYGISLTGKPLKVYGPVPGDIYAFPYLYDALTFDVFAYKGADTSQDYLVYDRCENFVITRTQDATYLHGSSEEIFMLEKRYWGYNTTMKEGFSNPIFNQHFQRYSVPGTFYTHYVIQFDNSHNSNWHDEVEYDNKVHVAIVSTDTATISSFEGIMNAFTGLTFTGEVVDTGVIPS